jgi:2-polyprenyl-6-methoxyphenol hydroxylase-like FAD-dependent oxidoreductase
MRVSQVVIEPVLREAIVPNGEKSPLVDARWGVALEDFTQDDTGVTDTLRKVETGATETVRCEFLAGCDGGSSLVRDKLGIGLSGRAQVAHRYMIHFRPGARSPAGLRHRLALPDRPGHLDRAGRRGHLDPADAPPAGVIRRSSPRSSIAGSTLLRAANPGRQSLVHASAGRPLQRRPRVPGR